MFELNDQKSIGQYLRGLIEKSEYRNVRQFCIAYLRANGDDEKDPTAIGKMQNRFSQITNGNKGLQLKDLPIICNLLNVACEQVLSAGTCFVNASSRLTNYEIALSKDEKEWNEYVNRNDKLLLNLDEYGKTVLDYAIENQNYDFIKFLIKKKYIWFDGKDETHYAITFGADTKIKPRRLGYIDAGLSSELAENDKLRTDIIALAVQNNDMDILDDMRAREVPELYNPIYNIKRVDYYKKYNKSLIERVVSSSNEIVDYFTDEIGINDRIKFPDGTHTYSFLFPYISELLDKLIKNNHDYTEDALNKCIKHNEAVYKHLHKMMEQTIIDGNKDGVLPEGAMFDKMRQERIDSLLDYLYFNPKGSVLSYSDYNRIGYMTNIAKVKATSKEVKIQNHINKLNELYEKILNIKDEFRVKEA